ncbi:hypothetical protein QVD17_14567 [Tagetes erecta]|uniref:Uncharacterized protein n=1 Tax=Tagetes erecta TaxID=13708 RepID=A0AAD8L3G2_TARER|nr:hypothetical protein QVD17_14567 [Tagetes erecta]
MSPKHRTKGDGVLAGPSSTSNHLEPTPDTLSTRFYFGIIFLRHRRYQTTASSLLGFIKTLTLHNLKFTSN